jgi:diacylglycerol kinase (ATP)
VKTVVIHNPTAGRDQGATVAKTVQRILGKRGFEVELRGTSDPHDATHIAKEVAGEADIIVAVGGDGTINEIVNGMSARRVRDALTGRTTRPLLGIVPAGTVNVLALELGIPSQVAKACRIIAEGTTMTLDLGKVNGRWFVLMMGAGIDALTIHNIDPKAKKRFRELAFVSTGVKAGLAGPPTEFLVRIGDEEHRATFFVAGNSRYYAGRLGVTPKADPTDGRLDLMLFRGTKRSSLAAFWLAVPTALHLQNDKVLYLCGERAELLPLDPEQVVWFQTDGELAGWLPATVEIDPHALDVLVPA